jgi:hypothetical protein
MHGQSLLLDSGLAAARRPGMTMERLSASGYTVISSLSSFQISSLSSLNSGVTRIS